MKVLNVHAEWDDEAGVWVATSDDVPGLVAEHATREGLVELVSAMIPELLELNGADAQEDVPFELVARSVTRGVARRAG